MAKKIRTCKICGKQYEYCGHCPTKNVIEPWRNLYCSENCREAFKVMGDYSVKKISALEARDALIKLGVSPKDVRDIHKSIVGEIYKAKSLSKEIEVSPPAPLVEESVVEGAPISVVEEVAIVEELVDEAPKTTEEKPAFHRNFKKKKRPNIVNDN